MKVEILKYSEITDNIQLQVAELYAQLNPTENQRSLEEVLAKNNNVVLVICKENSIIYGIALLVTYKVLAGYRGLIEDVVVDADQRGKGIGKKLMNKLLEQAKEIGLNEILLFSGHHRTAAISLYKSMGFTVRNSGIYQLVLE